MGPECITQKGPRPPSCMMAKEEITEEPVKEVQIQHEEELKEINLETKLGSQKPVFISKSADGIRKGTIGGLTPEIQRCVRMDL